MDEHQRTTIRLSKELHLASRIRALQHGTNLSEVIRRFLGAWVAGEIELPEAQEREQELDDG